MQKLRSGAASRATHPSTDEARFPPDRSIRFRISGLRVWGFRV